jgi:mRNA interferase MazF
MPKGNLTYQHGEIRYCKLDPTVGTEIRKTRPCVIVQNNIMNQYGSLTIVMPFRPGSKNAPYILYC